MNANLKDSSARLIPFNALNEIKMGGYWDNDNIIVKLPGLKYEKITISNETLSGIPNRENIVVYLLLF